MTTKNSHVILTRTLGWPYSAERALMGEAYENYATAQRPQVQLHNEWRRVRRLFDGNDDHAEVSRALSKATESALHLFNAKAQYRQAKLAAWAVAR
ncbi:hypothetical protein [Aeromicrobium sp.]|uniref:hypothetical protein n=1 Tax=Aeromicrobium sp. TaxID=1871063 RepID=UPI0030C294D7